MFKKTSSERKIAVAVKDILSESEKQEMKQRQNRVLNTSHGLLVNDEVAY